MGLDRIGRRAAAPLTAREVMWREPKAVQARGTVADLVRCFARPQVKSVVVVDGDRYVGVVERSALPPDASPAGPVLPLVRTDAPVVPAGAPMAEVLPLIDTTRAARVVVVEEDGRTLAGLLCPNSERTRFCRG